MSQHTGCLRAVSVSFRRCHANTCTTASQPEAVAGPLSMFRRRRSTVGVMCLAMQAVPLFARLQRSRMKLARLAVVLMIVTAGMVASMALSGCAGTGSKKIVYTVTPSGNGNETITPSTPQAVDNGASQAFTVTANAGYTLSHTVGGTCPAGSWSGNTYTTGAVTSNCSVSFSSTIDTYTVTASGDAHVTPSPSSQTVDYNQTGSITLTFASGYIATIASDTCGGSLSGNTYTTGAVTSNCSVSFSGVAVFPVADGPSNVIAAPGNGQVTISWTAPTNTGEGTISSYTVTYGPTSGTAFTAGLVVTLKELVSGAVPLVHA